MAGGLVCAIDVQSGLAKLGFCVGCRTRRLMCGRVPLRWWGTWRSRACSTCGRPCQPSWNWRWPASMPLGLPLPTCPPATMPAGRSVSAAQIGKLVLNLRMAQHVMGSVAVGLVGVRGSEACRSQLDQQHPILNRLVSRHWACAGMCRGASHQVPARGSGAGGHACAGAPGWHTCCTPHCYAPLHR